MPWCPKCRTEYRAGFSKCADCGSELVAEEPAEEVKVPAWMEDIPEEYRQAALQEEEVQISPEEAAKMRAAQMAAMQQAMEAAKQQQANGTAPRKKSTGPYRDSTSKMNDNKSSGWMLLIIGVLGLAFIILGFTGILPISFGRSYFFYGVIGVMFLLFIVGGVVSLKNAKTFSAQAESENSVRNSLKEWSKENLNAEEIDRIVECKNDSEEIVYFKRFSYLKFILNKQFVNLDQDMLDQFIDNYLYDEIFKD